MPNHLPHRVPVAILVASLASVVPAAARAGDPAAAQALYDEAKELASQGRYLESCSKLEASEKLDPGLGTEFHLADCWQHVGRSASAWAMFRQVESEARASGQAGRERVAHDRAEALGQFLSKIAIDAEAAAATPGLVVARDGVEIARDQWAEAVPVDPGSHVVSARAPGKQAWETTVQVMPDGKVVHVQIPALADVPVASSPVAPAPAPTPAPAPARAAAPAPAQALAPSPAASPTAPVPVIVVSQPRPGVTSAMPEEAPVLQDRGGAQRAVGWFFIGAGVAAVGASSYFWTKWLDERDVLLVPQQADATTQKQLAEITAGSGAGAIVLGAIIAATAPGPRIVPRSEAHVRVSPWLEPGRTGGLVVGGAF